MRGETAHRMRRPSTAACVAGFALAFAQVAASQTYIWMTPEYSTYTNYSYDGTYLYTSVKVDGYTSGTCPSQPASLANECHVTTHTPKVYNTIGGAGGWQSGGSVYWADYLSTGNDQEVAATPGTEYTFSWQGEVMCSAIKSAIYTASGSVTMAVGVDVFCYYKPVYAGGGLCDYVLYEANGACSPFICAANTTEDVYEGAQDQADCNPYEALYTPWVATTTSAACFTFYAQPSTKGCKCEEIGAPPPQ